MIRVEISLFLKKTPGELGKLTILFGEANINIDAITIQDVSASVQKLFEVRGKSLKRLASSASYSSMRWDSSEFAIIRLLTNYPEETTDLLKENNCLFDTKKIVALTSQTNPGNLLK